MRTLDLLLAKKTQKKHVLMFVLRSLGRLFLGGDDGSGNLIESKDSKHGKIDLFELPCGSFYQKIENKQETTYPLASLRLRRQTKGDLIVPHHYELVVLGHTNDTTDSHVSFILKFIAYNF